MGIIAIDIIRVTRAHLNTISPGIGFIGKDKKEKGIRNFGFHSIQLKPTKPFIIKYIKWSLLFGSLEEAQ
jgi:hypothetical protein